MGERVAVELAAHQSHDAVVAHGRLGVRRRRIAGLVESEVNQFVLGELRMQHHVMQPAVAVGRLECRNARDGHRVETGVPRPGVVDDPQRSAALRDQGIS